MLIWADNSTIPWRHFILCKCKLCHRYMFRLSLWTSINKHDVTLLATLKSSKFRKIRNHQFLHSLEMQAPLKSLRSILRKNRKIENRLYTNIVALALIIDHRILVFVLIFCTMVQRIKTAAVCGMLIDPNRLSMHTHARAHAYTWFRIKRICKCVFCAASACSLNDL